MTPVRMLRNERIAVDGLQVRWYRVGEIVNLPDSLAQALARDSIATNVLSPLNEDSQTNTAHQPKNELSVTRRSNPPRGGSGVPSSLRRK